MGTKPVDGKFVRDPFDYLATIEKVLREAPRVEKNGGVLVAQIPDDTCIAFYEFLHELLEGLEKAEKELGT